MEQLLSLLKTIPEYAAMVSSLQGGESVAVTGIGQINRSHMIAGLCRSLSRPMVVLCQDDLAARRLQEELKGFLADTAPILPGRDLTLYDAAVVSRSWEQKRLRQLYDLATGKTGLQIMTWESLSLRTMPKAALLAAAFSLEVGREYAVEDLISRLTAAGYNRCGMVEGPGQFAVRGGILDIFSPAEDRPVRAEFFGDELDTMGFFDPATQRRSENITSVTVLPVAETQPGLHPGGVEGLCKDITSLISRQKRRKNINEPLIATLEKDLNKYESGLHNPASDRYMALIYPEMATAADYIPDGAVVAVCDHGNLQRAARSRCDEMGMQLDSMLGAGLVAGELCDYVCQWEDFCKTLRKKTVVYFDAFGGTSYPEDCPPKQLYPLTAKQLPGYGGNLDTAVSDLSHYQKMEFGSLVLCGTRRRAELLQQLLHEKGLSAFQCIPLTTLPKPGQILLTEGTLPFGMEYPLSKIAVLTEGQLIARGESKRKPAKKTGSTNRQKLNSFTDLTPGDLVVHENYGIGRFVAMEQIKVDGAVKDYIKIAYQGSDTLFVPATQLDLVSKYIGGGGEDSNVKLNKIGSDAWQKTKAKARKAAKDMAGELIQLYAARKRQSGYAFSADAPWQKEFEDNFPYPETDDQLRCIADIKHDMESPIPMDRLLCGDVGFGKTEVALRAVMKAVMDGKQVAILVPTTVLAQQHYQTAVARFRGFPVTIDVLSRFRTPKMQQQTLQKLRAGSVDLIIGTHKLLQKTVQFKDLGLLIVDEEQRFGVSHKERLKELSKGVDVLTLSATPIPRTLNMALSGIRDMSTIEQPPADRYPVQTFVMEYSEPIVDDAIRREIERGGQVYYLHNRTETIDQCAAAIKRRIPGISVGVAHGQMGEDALGDVMQSMAEGEIQVLVCTTIIETGLDIPNANTLIIENADRFGLSQLHQLRGCLFHLPSGEESHRGRREAAICHPGLCRIRLRLQNRHAGPGNPGRGQSLRRRAVRSYVQRGLRYVPQAAGRGSSGGKGRSPQGTGMHRRPERHRQCGQRLRLPGRGTDGPVPPHGRHPLSGRCRRSSGRNCGPLRRAAQGRAESHRYRPSPGKGKAGRHQGHPPEVRGRAVHPEQSEFRGRGRAVFRPGLQAAGHFPRQRQGTHPPLQARQRRGQSETEQAVCGALYQLFPELTFLTFCVIISVNLPSLRKGAAYV